MVIGIDTSGGVCSVAAVSDSNLICEFSINHKKTHSAMLIPMLDEMLNKAELSLEDASLFAVASGPGSFTGLRIGAASAKGLSFALDRPIVGVPTLMALSFNLSHVDGVICPIMDARRNQIYTAAYSYEKDGIDTINNPLVSPDAIAIDDLLKKLKSIGERVTFLGDGVPVYRDLIESKAEFDYRFAPTNLMLQRASSVAILGELLAQDGKSGPSDSLRLEYLRRPQAERERLGL